MKAHLLFFLLGILSFNLSAQNQRPIPPSPNAASLGIFGKIPVDYFTGIPSVNVPIYTIKNGLITVPVSLSYHTGLLKPDQHPGWVGLGWNLSAGGAITRKVNSTPDELELSSDDPDYSTDPSHPYRYSYIDNYSALNTSSWYSSTFFNNHNVNTNPYDLDPDEFDFNFGNYSGSFYMDHNGVWQVKSNTPAQLKVTFTTTETFSLQSVANYFFNGQSPVQLPRIFYSFTITTEDGTQYQFGNDDNAIEFSRPLPANDNAVPFSTGASSFYVDQIRATTWMLTKIISPKGDIITFKYTRDGINTIRSSSTNLYNYTEYNGSSIMQSGSGGGIELYTYSIVNPVYLTEIDTKHATLKFVCSNSNQMDYSLNKSILAPVSGWDIPGKATHAYQYPDNTWKKLDSIKLLIDQVPTTNYVLKYKDTITSRLFLLSFQQQGATGNAIAPPYQFFYNPMQLPAYNSFQTDHWGFYNGKRFSTLYPTHTSDFSYLPQYKASRDPDSTYLYASVLDSLIYPTGGSTAFVYSPNSYSSVTGRYPFQTTATAIDSVAGGLRIHYIKNYIAAGQLTNTKEYLYQQSGSARSSGILGGTTVYLEKGTQVPLNGTGLTLTYNYWYNYSVEPLSYNKGSNISYTRVIERDIDASKNASNGYTVYAYSNFDNTAYQDKPFIATVQGITYPWTYDPYNSAEHERGSLLSKTDYDSQNRIIKQTTMTYDTTENLSPNNVRAWSHVGRMIGPVLDYRYTAYLNYTNKPYLKTKEEDTYSYSPNTEVTDITNYYYDNPAHGQLTRTVTSKSTGQVITAASTYANDYSPGTTFIDDMVTNHQIGIPIEQVTYQNDSNGTKILHGRINEYKAGGKGLVDKEYSWYSVPVGLASFKFSDRAIGQLPYGGSSAAYVHDTPYTLTQSYNGYDAAGNLRMVTPASSIPTSYQWGYNKTYPVAMVKNADTTEFYYEGFEESTASGVISTAFHTGTKSSTATTVNWTKPSGSIRTFVISYWYYNGISWQYKAPVSYTGTSYTLTGGSAYDDICILPSDAQITAYTYAPLVGMTSSTDAKGEVTYYEYDSFQRLMNIKDKDGNIIKSYTYHYQGQ